MLVVLFVCGIANAYADESGWRSSSDATLYGYANSMKLNSDSILNPNNQIARITRQSDVAEIRMNLKLENETVRFTARPIASTRELRNGFATQQRSEGYISQWQARVRMAEAWNVAAGREVLNWGAGQFRSPSSPFYFDNGRSDPMRELSGMDALKLTWTPDMQSSATLARIVRSGYGAVQPDVWRDSWLAKFDQRGEAWSYGVVAAKAQNMPAFYGANAQRTLSDELMLYGEVGSSAQTAALQSPADISQPFNVLATAPRSSTELMGAAYTFENGQSLNAEYLHEGRGYTAAQENAYFQRAIVQPAIALGLMPRLLGRDYLHLVWQSNMMESDGYWRLMLTHSLTDGSSALGAYGERSFNGHLSAFAMAAMNGGNARQEMSAIYLYSITLGLKVALP
jgi:hypothetical protein